MTAMNRKKKNRRWYESAIEVAEVRGLTRRDLVDRISRICSVGESTVYSWLNGNREPPLESIRAIAREVLKVNVGDLLEDDPLYAAISPEEREFLNYLRQLSQDEQALLRGLVASKAKEKRPQDQ